VNVLGLPILANGRWLITDVDFVLRELLSTLEPRVQSVVICFRVSFEPVGPTSFENDNFGAGLGFGGFGGLAFFLFGFAATLDL
jgi:hypothetical protein